MTEADTTAPERPGRGAVPGWAWAVAGLVVVACLVPLLFLGPGTDLDAGPVIRAGRSIVHDHTYVASRPPGAPVHETGVGLLDALGGTVATNLGSLLAAIACVVLLVALLRQHGVGRTGLVAAALVANPWFLLAATSTVDFLWAIAFVLGAAVALRARHPVWAGVLAALAIGTRSSSVVLVAALVLAEALDRPVGVEHDGGDGEGGGDGAGGGGGGRAATPVARAAVVVVVAAVGALVLFVPSFRASGDSLAFAQNDVPTSGLAVQAGRFLVKDLYLVGPFAAVVLLLCIPAVVRSLGLWRASWLVRFSTVGLVLSQVLFLRFPWKMGHLLPSLVCLVLLLGVALRDKAGLLVAFVVAQAVYCVASISLVRPDTPNAATGGRLTFDPGWGVLVVDTQCRADDTGAWKSLTPDRADAVWTCAKPWTQGTP